MIDFQIPQLADKGWMDQLLSRSDYRGCEYNFTNLYTWKDAYHHQVARLDDFLLVHLCGGLGCSYLYPAGSGDRAAVIDALRADAEERGQPLRLVCLTKEQTEELETLFPGRFQTSTAWPT